VITAIFQPSDTKQEPRTILSAAVDGRFGILSDIPSYFFENMGETGQNIPLPSCVWGAVDLMAGDISAQFSAGLRLGVRMFVLRHCQGPADVERASVLLTVCELEAGLADGSADLVACPADSAACVQALAHWTFLPQRLRALIFDPQRLAVSMALPSPLLPDGSLCSPLATARDLSLFAAHSLRLPLYDATRWPTSASISEQICMARSMGFAGLITQDESLLPLIAGIFADGITMRL
jgi:hypothetical protein